MDHAATVRRLYDLLDAGDVDAFGDLLADDFVEHEELPGLAPSKDGVKTFFRGQIAAFPDLRMTVEDLVTDGAKAVARVRYTGTQLGAFNGMPATGKAVDIQSSTSSPSGRRPHQRALGRPGCADDDAAARPGTGGSCRVGQPAGRAVGLWPPRSVSGQSRSNA